jgi:predicted amidohydrolase YtcJ
LRGKTILPGLTDAHLHGASAGAQRLLTVDAGVTSLAELKKRLRERAAQTPKGQWIRGSGYDDTKYADLNRFLIRTDIDDVTPEHPVIISHRGGHVSFVNSAALRMAKIDKSTTNPSGGVIDRDAKTFEPTGVLRERAAALVSGLVPPFSRDEQMKGVVWMLQQFAKSGLTSVHDANTSIEGVRAYMDAYQRGELAVRVYMMVGFAGIGQLKPFGIRTGFGDSMLRVGGTKLGVDGAISTRTAALSEPYVGRPDDRGIVTRVRDEYEADVREAHAEGWQIGTHANGDVAIQMVLDAYEKALKETPKPNHRFRIEHCTLVNPQILKRMQALQVIPTPFCSYVYWHSDKMPDYGPERLEWMFAMRSFLDHGIPVTGSSDYTPGPYEPLMGIMSCVTRKGRDGKIWGPSQKISVDEAIRCYTRNGSYASFDENRKGAIEAGKLADLVVLGQDPYRVDPDAIIDIPVEKTMVGGRWVWESAS